MTQPPYPPPPPGPPPAWQPPPQPPRKPRPRALWFVVGGVLIVLAPIVFAGALFTVLRPMTQEDAVFSVADGPQQVSLPPGQERAIFSTRGISADCAITEGSGERVATRPVTGEFTYNQWTAVSRFDTGDGDLTFDCQGVGGDESVRIAQLPSTGAFVAGIAVGVIVPILLFIVGLVTLIVTGLRWATGAPRQKSG